MKTLKVRYTRGDEMTMPGGIILREKEHGDGEKEYIVHNFSRAPGHKEPSSFFWGRYLFDLNKAESAFNEKVANAGHYDRGGSLIPVHREDIEIEGEMK